MHSKNIVFRLPIVSGMPPSLLDHRCRCMNMLQSGTCYETITQWCLPEPMVENFILLLRVIITDLFSGVDKTFSGVERSTSHGDWINPCYIMWN